MSTHTPLAILPGLSALADRYDGYIVDLWGTVHNGVVPFEGAIACLEALRRAGKKIVMLSNAPRPAHVVVGQLEGFGVSRDLHDGVMTSGEETHRLLLERTDPWFARLGQAALHIGGTHDLALYEKLNIQRVSTPEEADFIVNTGPDLERGVASLDPYLPELRASLARQLPMICANPDRVVVKGGQRQICAGALAAFYEEQGGDVRWIGKPYPTVYEPVFTMLGVPRDRILAIGDALETDVKGAAAAGVDSLWVLGGIHQEMIGNDAALADAEARSAGLSPVAAVPRLVW
ncbi:TIGR01459 family HAD-type hydrolase [Acetobacter vaccinii]|uniref:TIGR01459 family HAD-type hydrolase n=1 Tax=Acetobacter vaccinii TaxID=2592655 RepID=A0A5C1YNL5_9PROT|nr:TIGR01459 family HAD-type hydrolase [Acetobacter vaccinii]QEO16779.1 TIGR01459 family HAD-type hydrolase [Acetobacter vaccinii]